MHERKKAAFLFCMCVCIYIIYILTCIYEVNIKSSFNLLVIICVI